MIRYGELNQVIAAYTLGDLHDSIPVEYYRQVIKLAISMQHDGRHWSKQHSAIILLHNAHGDGILQTDQLTPDGLKALNYADKLLMDYGMNVYQGGDESQFLLRSIA